MEGLWERERECVHVPRAERHLHSSRSFEQRKQLQPAAIHPAEMRRLLVLNPIAPVITPIALHPRLRLCRLRGALAPSLARRRAVQLLGHTPRELCTVERDRGPPSSAKRSLCDRDCEAAARGR